MRLNTNIGLQGLIAWNILRNIQGENMSWPTFHLIPCEPRWSGYDQSFKIYHCDVTEKKREGKKNAKSRKLAQQMNNSHLAIICSFMWNSARNGPSLILIIFSVVYIFNCPILTWNLLSKCYSLHKITMLLVKLVQGAWC